MAKNETRFLIFASFIISICGIIYELLISTLASYYLGSSILHFSLTIGLFMFFMGVGAYLSKYIKESFIDWFILIQILLAFIGGFSTLFLSLSFTFTDSFYVISFLIITVISTLTGLEVPLLTHILSNKKSYKESLSLVLTFDYIGALFGSILFPLFLLEILGVLPTSFVVGFLNLVVAMLCIYKFRSKVLNPRLYSLYAIIIAGFLVSGFSYSASISTYLERKIYQDEIIYSKQSKYQKIILTKFNEDTRLFLNGNLQFSTIDEHRYHQPLVHIPMSIPNKAENVLVLGGGDGLVARELLKYQGLKSITIVDIDEAVTNLARTHPILTGINEDSFSSKKVKVINQDAFNFIQSTPKLYEVIIIDLPDPSSISISKLYTKEFYSLVKKKLAFNGVFITQASSPYFAREVFWSIEKTIASVFDFTYPYTNYVPSFGQWGFVIGSSLKVDFENLSLNAKLTGISKQDLKTYFHFDSDMSKIDGSVNTLQNHKLLRLYEKSWGQWYN